MGSRVNSGREVEIIDYGQLFKEIYVYSHRGYLQRFWVVLWFHVRGITEHTRISVTEDMRQSARAVFLKK